MSVLDELEPPERKDFRRVGKQVPYIMGADGKRVRYSRSSSAGKILDDESALHDWQRRTIVYGAAQRPDLMAQVSTLDQATDKKEIRDIAEECLVAGKGRQRATTGTAIHRMLDRIDAGDEWEPAPQFKDAVDAYVLTCELYGLVPVDIECHCVNDTYRLAGTMDRRYRTTRNLIAPSGEIVPIGSVLAADTKTGQSLEYAAGSYATQLAAYATSLRYDVDTDERCEFDPPTYPDWALILHVVADDGRCDVYWVDLEAGREALALAHRVRAWRDRTDLIVPARAPLHAVRDEPPASAPTTPGEASEAGSGTVAVREWLRGRVGAVRACSDAAVKQLQRQWPEGVPGLKFDTQTPEELDAIAEVLWQVEADHGIAFPETDPRIAPDTTYADRWAKPTGDDMPDNPNDLLAFRQALDAHPRRALLMSWAGMAQRDIGSDRWALAHALYEFAMLEPEWADDDITEMLDGTLRAIGYGDGMQALGDVAAEHAPLIMSSAFAITAGTAMLMYGKDGKPVVRVIT